VTKLTVLLHHIICVTKCLDCGKTYSDNCYVILCVWLSVWTVTKLTVLLHHIMCVTKCLDCGKTYSDNCYVIFYV